MSWLFSLSDDLGLKKVFSLIVSFQKTWWRMFEIVLNCHQCFYFLYMKAVWEFSVSVIIICRGFRKPLSLISLLFPIWYCSDSFFKISKIFKKYRFPSSFPQTVPRHVTSECKKRFSIAVPVQNMPFSNPPSLHFHLLEVTFFPSDLVPQIEGHLASRLNVYIIERELHLHLSPRPSVPGLSCGLGQRQYLAMTHSFCQSPARRR